MDVDHLVADHGRFVGHPTDDQVFSGKADLVTVIHDGDAATIRAAVKESFFEAKGRCIVSAGCEVPRDTPVGNMEALKT